MGDLAPAPIFFNTGLLEMLLALLVLPWQTSCVSK
jgi:hypothetical protein